MKSEQANRSYAQLSPSPELADFIDSYWEHKNTANKSISTTIVPDSFFKIIIFLVEGEIESYFLTGIWTDEKEFVIPENTTVYGIRFNILAPEYLLNQELKPLLNTHKDLEVGFLGAKNFNFDSLEQVVAQFETILIKNLKQNKQIHEKKVQLSQLLYQKKGEISAEEVAKQVKWSNRQITRYFNKYLGLSLKKYLNIQKCYASYIHIREGKFFPEKDFYDQAHFIKEIKKYTGLTPKELHRAQNDRFIQLKDIKK